MNAADATADLLEPQRGTPCLARLTAARQWDPTIAVRVGHRVLGIRATSGAAPEVEEVVASRRAPEYDDTVAPHFSIDLPAPAQGRRGLCLVHRDHQIVARRRTRSAVLEDLVALLDAWGHRDRREGLAIRGCVLVTGRRRAVLLPPQWHRALLLHQERLAGEGVELLVPDEHAVTSAGEVVLSASASTAAPRVPLVRWALRIDDGPDRDIRPAQAVHLGFFTVANLSARGPRSVLDDLAGLAGLVPAVGVRARPRAHQLTVGRGLAHDASTVWGGASPAPWASRGDRPVSSR